MSGEKQVTLSRRRFVQVASTIAVAAGGGLPLFHFRQAQAATGGSRNPEKLGNWEDLYRQRWSWDYIAKGSHGWVNCRSACEWDLYVKDGIVVREEQTATYEASEPGVPDFNPRGCQKGACYTDVMYGPSRTTVPLKRTGERGSGKWEKISWDRAIDEIAHKMIDIAKVHGADTHYTDLGPNFDFGATTMGRFKFLHMSGGTFADNWGEIGDLNIGATMTVGAAHIGGSSDEWFLSDFLVVWMMNPSVTQIADAHFLYEAKYNGAELVVIDPQYSATAVHADQWLPLRSATDAALGMATARHIWDSGNIDLPYVREQTDLPILVRLDTGRFLRETDMLEGGRRKLLYMWDPAANKPVEAPGTQESEQNLIRLPEGFEPPIEGSFTVTLKGGKEISVAPVGSLLKENLEPWTFEKAAEITGLSVAQIRRFAEGFANAERPMVLSSWGANRYVHSDLMNRAKLLCLSLKGAIGKKGAGYQGCGWVDLGGFGLNLQVEHEGIRGKLGMMLDLMSPSDLWHMTMDIMMKRKTQEQVTRDGERKYEAEILCATNVTSMDLHHQDIVSDMDRDLKDDYPRPFSEYFDESVAKGWDMNLPRSGSPKIFFSGGSNLIRRTNNTQKFIDNIWNKMELIVDINPKFSYTALQSDYILPAAGYYEKSGIKYSVSYIPYVHYCDAAVPPLGEAKDEYEFYWLLSKRIEELAIEQDLPVFDGCGKLPTDWKTLNQRYSSHGQFGPKDAEKVSDTILADSHATAGVTVEQLKKTGIAKYTSTGDNVGPTALYNPDWKGDGVLTTMTQFTEHKDHWPTYSGRITTYIDHPWFIEARENMATHKESPKAGGDHPFQLVSCHSRWSIHSTWRDTPLLLRMQRGEPVMYVNPMEAKQLNIADHDYAELYNDYGTVTMRIKYSTMVRPGVAYYFHAWEPNQFPNHESYKWLIPGLVNPLHLSGDYYQLQHGVNKYQPGTAVQDTRISIRAIDQASVENSHPTTPAELES
ncbi:MAG: molybdopterin-dependent oxidoreductase [Proteobacteria bacterium]|nr:molybdopterin-dependent oxidoreductase [Pseudomonadota bacterium]